MEDCSQTGWEGGSRTRREGRCAGHHRTALPGRGHSVKASPCPGIYSLFIGDEKRNPVWVGQPVQPSLPGHLPPRGCSVPLAQGPANSRGAGTSGAAGRGLGTAGAPRGSLLPPLQMRGVHSSGGQLGRRTGLPEALASRPQCPGFHLVNKHWLWDWTSASPWQGQEGGGSARARICPCCPHTHTLCSLATGSLFSPAGRRLPFLIQVSDPPARLTRLCPALCQP